MSLGSTSTSLAALRAETTAASWATSPASRHAARKASFRRPLHEPIAARVVGSGHVLGRRYRLTERLAEGGMGTLWAATDETTRRDVVVKLMGFELTRSAEAVGRFRQEADLIAAIDCPYIVRFIDEGVVGDAPYLVLERLRGEDLAQRLARGPLDLGETAVVLEHMAHALHAAHVLGVVHRDVKPANIFLTTDLDAAGRPLVKLLDFGVAKLSSGGRFKTGAGIAVGSPSFMSPEQLQGLPGIDGRSDLFGLAAVAHACLTGTSPFAGVHLHDTFQRIMRGIYQPVTAVQPSLPPDLDDFFAQALAVRPQDRFATGAAMARAFRSIVDEAQGSPTVRGKALSPDAA